MGRDFLKIYEDSQPLSRQAAEALRRYHEGRMAGLPAEEVERLKAQAEFLFKTVSDFQLRAMGLPSPTLQ
ncbi:hypothetical protein F3J44_21230 [Pantoea sp. Tr-811]|uniref:hypothetical protein n=1 Tax=Pantoea sp. Tr-811 TaxID=2608361 RepID=UPI0014225826|nr:hypothetical protein [Pantoea sp. Tr-811]NIF28890.1 hypothetical protein [Pantoea sp. Tr-811]